LVRWHSITPKRSDVEWNEARTSGSVNGRAPNYTWVVRRTRARTKISRGRTLEGETRPLSGKARRSTTTSACRGRGREGTIASKGSATRRCHLPLLLSLTVSTPVLPLQRPEQRCLCPTFVLDICICVEVLCFFLACRHKILSRSRKNFVGSLPCLLSYALLSLASQTLRTRRRNVP